MKVVVVAPSPVPLRAGGAERLWAGLLRGVGERAGTEADLVKLPVRELTLSDLVAGYEAFSALDLSHADLVISGKYPAWMVDHPRHVVWMLHPLRGLYEAYDPALDPEPGPREDPDLGAVCAIVDHPPDAAALDDLFGHLRRGLARLEPGHPDLAIPSPLARVVVRHLDRIALSRARISRHAAISATVAGRTGYFPADVAVDVVHPPSDLVPHPPAGYDRVFFTVSRLESAKRIELLIDAFSRVTGDARLVIAGDGPDRDRLARRSASDPRVELVGRLDDEALAGHYSRCRGVPFVPRDEDFGYVTLEAWAHARPVVTTGDSGGPAELVEDGRTGLVVEPDPASIAGALDRLLVDEGLARRLGEAGAGRAASITWPGAVERLVGGPARSPSSGRRRIVAVASYPVHEAPTGGQERARYLLEGLSEQVDVALVGFDAGSRAVGHRRLGDRLTETTVPRSARHLDATAQIQVMAGDPPVTDIADSRLWAATPSFVRELDRALADAGGVVCEHPYLYGAVAALRPDLPVVLDAHNVESAMKAQLLPREPGRDWLLRQVEQIERDAVTNAVLIATVTAGDADALASAYGPLRGRTSVVPNGVDSGAIELVTGAERERRGRALLSRLGRRERHLVTFVGSGHAPNVEAGRVLLSLAPSFPDTCFVLVGAHCGALEGSSRSQNVVLLGTVDDDTLVEVLGGATAALNPMELGGGSNLKLLRYLAAGVPVVTTEMGARGHGHPEEFAVVAPISGLAEALAPLLADPSAGAGRVAAGRRLAEGPGDWRAIGRRYAELVVETLGW